MNTELKRLEALKAELVAFRSSAACDLYLKETHRDLKAVETRIIEDEILDVKDIFELLDLRGQRKVLLAQTTLFEDAVANLNNQIEELILAEQPNATQQETIDD